MNIFIGNFIEVLQAYHFKMTVDLVIVEKNKVNSEIKKYVQDNRIQIIEIESVKQIEELAIKHKFNLVIIASFGIILSHLIIQKSDKILNFHPGSLETCRGRHPLPFAIKKKLDFMSITVHEIINTKVDNGPVICELKLPINYNTSYEENEKYLRSFLKNLTVSLLDNILTNSLPTSSIIVGGYNQKLSSDELEQIINTKNLSYLKL